MQKIIIRLFSVLLVVLVSASCTRKEIQFGDTTEESYTKIIYIDTVKIDMNTILIDSFITNSPTAFLMGRYKDPALGLITAKAYFQLSTPGTDAVNDLNTLVYDSATFIIHPNGYYYGDTAKPITYRVSELAAGIEYTYSNNLYNTSDIAVKTSVLGSKTTRISPATTNSVEIRIDDTRGRDLFAKLKAGADEIADQRNFLNYFKGICVSAGATDTAAVYGLEAAAGQCVLRIYYHNTTPYLENRYVDFKSLSNTYSFNHVSTERTGTPFYSATGATNFPSATTNDIACTQYGAGMLLKMTFPSLPGIINSTDKIVKLRQAVVVLRPVSGTFDYDKNKLPEKLYLAQTNSTNTIGSAIMASTTDTVFSKASIDDIYGLDNSYKFDVTYYLNSILSSGGSSEYGFFLLQNSSWLAPKIDRALISNTTSSTYKSQLLLTVVVINK